MSGIRRREDWLTVTHLGVDVVQQLDVQLILPTLSPVTGEQQLVVHHADVGILAVHHLHREEDKSLPLVPAAMRSELPRVAGVMLC